MAKKVNNISPTQKEFNKVKRFICKRFPGARTEAFMYNSQMCYRVVDGDGINVVDSELMLPPCTTVLQAWLTAKYAVWFTNMVRKSNNAFTEEKIYKKLAKEACE